MRLVASAFHETARTVAVTRLKLPRLGPDSPLLAGVNARRGATAHRHGRDAEAEMDLAIEGLAAAGRAMIAPVRPLTGGRPGAMFFRKAAPVDRVGWLRSPEPSRHNSVVEWRVMAVAFDIKATDRPELRAPAATRDNGKALARFMVQLDWLRRFGRPGGCLGFFAVRHKATWWGVLAQEVAETLVVGKPVPLSADEAGVRGPYQSAEELLRLAGGWRG